MVCENNGENNLVAVSLDYLEDGLILVGDPVSDEHDGLVTPSPCLGLHSPANIEEEV